jgi:hypothetical protein
MIRQTATIRQERPISFSPIVAGSTISSLQESSVATVARFGLSAVEAPVSIFGIFRCAVVDQPYFERGHRARGIR